MFKEILIVGIQYIFSSFLFDAPFFSQIKKNVYKIIFNFKGRKILIRRGTYLISPHTRKYALLEIRNNVLIKHRCDIDYSGGLTIDDNVNIAQNVCINTHSHIIKDSKFEVTENISNEEKMKYTKFSKLHIGKGVIIGEGAIILASVNYIGKGAVISAGAVVVKDVEPYCVIMGNPARVIFKRI
jgi:acetyltransferase-like isoleucine patch superfamily enzyme